MNNDDRSHQAINEKLPFVAAIQFSIGALRLLEEDLLPGSDLVGGKGARCVS